MGCASSLLEEERGNNQQRSDLTKEIRIDSKNPKNILAEYIATDQEIVHLENLSVAPTFARAVSAIRQIKIILEELEVTPDKIEDDENQDDVEKLFIELGLHRSPSVAAEHEEFIANANRRILNKNRVNLFLNILEVNDKKLRSSSEKVNYLQMLYQKQEALLMSVFGAAYGSDKEMSLEQETDTMRNFRDAMAMGVLQWTDSLEDLQGSSNAAQRGIISWRSLKKQSIENKLKLASDARDNIQEAVLLIQLTQLALPGVQFPYCSTREVTAVNQAIEYIFTDILIGERYNHALEVYENFQKRIVALHKWMTKTMASSLQRDLVEFDDKVVVIAKKLREERVNHICKKLKIPNDFPESRIHQDIGEENNSLYQRPMKPETRYTKESMYGDVLASQVNLGPSLGYQERSKIFSDPNLQRDFESKLAARRSAMWPSRRMEELRQLTLNDGL